MGFFKAHSLSDWVKSRVKPHMSNTVISQVCSQCNTSTTRKWWVIHSFINIWQHNKQITVTLHYVIICVTTKYLVHCTGNTQIWENITFTWHLALLTPGCAHRQVGSNHCESWWWGGELYQHSSCCAARSSPNQSRSAGTGQGPSSHWGNMSQHPLRRCVYTFTKMIRKTFAYFSWRQHCYCCVFCYQYEY